VGLDHSCDVEAVTDALRAAGASYVSKPPPSLPDVLVAQFPDGSEDDTLTHISHIPRVRYAEIDQPRFSS